MSEQSAGVMMPLELLERLGPLAEQMGIQLPGAVRFAPTIDASQPIRALALELGRLAARQNLFRMTRTLVTVDPKTGEELEMTSARFVGWIEDFCAFTGLKQTASLTRETAALVLAQDIFRDCLSEIEGVHPVRLPVMREDGTVELLPPGYDPKSRIFTVETLVYDYHFSEEDAGPNLADLLRSYPWGEEEKIADVRQSRSAAVAVFSMLGFFCRGMFPAGTTRPAILYIGNQVGTGKSTLAAIGPITVFGVAGRTDIPNKPEKMETTLEAIALSMSPYLFFDDAPGGVFSNALNRFITAGAHAGRVFHTQKTFCRPNVTQVLITGNSIKTTADIMRRSLVVELFLAGDARERRFDPVITETWLALPAQRAHYLAVLWAAVRRWISAGCWKHPAPLPTFEDWSSVIAAIVQELGFTDPLKSPDLISGGDEQSREIKDLLALLADEVESGETKNFSRQEIVDKARGAGLLVNLVGHEDDPALTSTESKVLGARLVPWRGRSFRDTEGRGFTFFPDLQGTGGRRARTNKGKLYPIRVHPPVTAAIVTEE